MNITCMCLSVYVRLSVCQSSFLCLFVRLFVSLFVRLLVQLTVSMFVQLAVPCVRLATYPTG